MGASTGMHSVKVVDEAFHSLESLVFSILLCFVNDNGWNLEGFEGFFVAVFNIFWNGYINFFTGEFVIFFKISAEGFLKSFVDTGSHSVVEIWNSLAAVLLILIGLKDDGSECSIGANGVRRAKMAMTSIKTAISEEL